MAGRSGRITERRHPQNGNVSATPGDYHLPFAKAEAQSEGLTLVLAGLSHLIKYRPRPGQGAVSFTEARKFVAAELT